MPIQTFFLFILLLVLACTGCERSTQEELQKKILRTVEDLKNQSGEPLKEVEKLHQLEYHVASFPADSSARDLEAAMMSLGKNRWDCFHVERSLEKTRAEEKPELRLLVFCKRLPDTLLRYVPRHLIGR